MRNSFVHTICHMRLFFTECSLDLLSSLFGDDSSAEHKSHDGPGAMHLTEIGVVISHLFTVFQRHLFNS